MATATDNPISAEWDTESGLFEEGTCKIAEAHFTVDQNYMNGAALLLRFKLEDEEEVEHEISFPCGKGWLSEDGGKTATHENGKVKFNERSWVGLLIDRFAKGSLGELVQKVMQERGSPRSASTWTGLLFDWKNVEVDFGMVDEKGEKKTSKRPMPVKFLGVVDGPGKKIAPVKSSANGKAASKPAPVEEEEPEEEEVEEETPPTKTTKGKPGPKPKAAAPGPLDLFNTLPKPVQAKLKMQAKKADGAEGFEVAAYDFDEIINSEPLIAVVSDGSLYTALLS